MRNAAAVAAVALVSAGGLTAAATPAVAGNGSAGSGGATTRQLSTSTQRPGSSFGPWRPLANKAFTAHACNTTVRVTYPVSREQIRTRLDSAGNEIQEIRGRLVASFTPLHTKRHYIFDVSGASVGAFPSIAYKNGDFLFGATGSNFFGFSRSEQKETGLPRSSTPRPDVAIIVTQGPVRFLFHGKNPEHVDVITRPHGVIDVCRLINGT